MNRDWSDLIVRMGLAFAFLYPPINALFDPDTWFGYFPYAVRALAESMHIPDMLLLHGFGVIEVILALWILSGWRVMWPSLVAALMLLAIVLTDLRDFQILFRDLSIMALALALAVKHRKIEQPRYDILG